MDENYNAKHQKRYGINLSIKKEDLSTTSSWKQLHMTDYE